MRHDLHPGEQAVEMRRDHLLDRDEPFPIGQREEPRQQRRHLDPREPPHPGDGVAHHDGQVQREARDVGERMRGVDRERREDREDALGERVRGPRAILVGEIRGVDQADPLLVERRPELVGEEPLDAGGGRRDPAPDLGELLLGPHPVRGRGDDPRLDLLQQTGDPDLEELVEVLRTDREELHPRQDRPPSSSASARTRSLKSSQDSSRLRYREAGSAGEVGMGSASIAPMLPVVSVRVFPR